MNTTDCTTTPVAGPTPVTCGSEAVPQFHYAPLYWLAVGTFAVGTEGFMIAAILPRIATDLFVSVQAAGQLVTIFAFTYAVSSPVLTALTGGFDRRKLLILSMSAFAAANLAAAWSQHFWSLAVARILIAAFAGLYVPGANALAGALAPSERRGRALAIVSGGMSLAVALGVPLGAFIGNRFGWRMNFIGMAGLSVIAVVGLLFGLPKGIGEGLVTASLRERIAVVRQPSALFALCITTLWAVGTYSVFTYIALFLATVVGLKGATIGYALFLWGVAAFIGLLLGGLANDRIGSRRVIFATLSVMALALMSLTLVAHFLAQSTRLVPVLIAMVIWGLTAWGFFPAQQSRLIGITGLRGTAIILSLNASFMYLGFSLGAAAGSFVLTQGNVTDLGWVGGLWVVSSLTLFILSDGRTKQLQPTRTKENK